MAQIDKVLYLVGARSAKQANDWAQQHNLVGYYRYLYKLEDIHGRRDCYIVMLPGFYQNPHYDAIQKYLKTHSKIDQLKMVSYLNPTMVK